MESIEEKLNINETELLVLDIINGKNLRGNASWSVEDKVPK